MNPNLLILFGIVLGVVLGVSAVSLAGFSKLPLEGWAFFGGVAGAALTVYAAAIVADQQRKARQQELAEESHRKQLGARAILALDLSRIIEYTEESAAAAMLGDRLRDVGSLTSPVTCPEINAEVLARLQALAELLEPDDADQVVDLMHCYQVQRARLSDPLHTLNTGETGDIVTILTKNNFEFTLQSTIELFLRAEAMFPFARRSQESITPPPFAEDRVHSAIRQHRVENWLSDFEQANIVQLMTNLTIEGRWRGTPAVN